MTIIGIDTGGTFTDFIWLGEDGRPRIHKQPATPDDPSRAVLDGLIAAGRKRVTLCKAHELVVLAEDIPLPSRTPPSES